ncbi:MAG: TlpA disulfide reductase family protein [candidate division WOR-3 bacterium]
MKQYLIILCLIMCFLSVFCANKNSKPAGTANDFTLTSLDGNEYTLSKLTNQVVIVDFWATWCPPCKREIPHLIEIYDKYKDKGLIILGVSTEEKNTLETFSQQNKINYPILLGTNEVFQKFGVSSIPHTLFIDKKGKVRKVQIGYADELIPVFEALIDTLLNE